MPWCTVVAEGLLLASPRIFREFAKQQVGGSRGRLFDAAKRVQREVLREGWHLRADRGVSILCYEKGRNARGRSDREQYPDQRDRDPRAAAIHPATACHRSGAGARGGWRWCFSFFFSFST
jgi:hypothetical protein